MHKSDRENLDGNGPQASIVSARHFSVDSTDFVTKPRRLGSHLIKLFKMTTSVAALPRRSAAALPTILKAGLLAGLLDGLDAAVIIAGMNHISPVRVFRFIASGVLGLSAFHGGPGIAALGVVLHFVIAIGAAATFYAISRVLPMVLRRPLLWGSLFGLGVYFFMHYLVVPLSRTPRQPPMATWALINLLFSHIFFVGIPIALVTARASRPD